MTILPKWLYRYAKLSSIQKARGSSLPARERSAILTHTNKLELMSIGEFSARQRVVNLRKTEPNTGHTRSGRIGHGLEFAGVRAYAPGDDIRHINWRLTARTGEPLTKLYAEEHEVPIYIILDQRSQMYFGSCTAFKSVVAARIAALIVWLAHCQNYRVGGVILSEQTFKLNMMRGQKGVIQILEQIAEVNQTLRVSSQSVQALHKILFACYNQTPTGARLVIISDFADFNTLCQSALQLLNKRHALRLIKISDTLEDSMPSGGVVGISDGDHVNSVSLSSAICEHYQTRQTQLNDQLNACATNFNTEIHYINQKQKITSSLRERTARGIFGTQ